MPLIPYPDVPNTDGVPTIPRSPNFPPVAGFVLDSIQGAIWRAFQVEQKWGIWTLKKAEDGKDEVPDKPFYDPQLFPGFVGVAVGAAGGLLPGNLIGSATLSVGSLEYAKEMRVSAFPIEKGGFASYNKVEMPANPVMTLYFSGTETERKAFIDKIDAATKSLELFAIVTPEANYIGYTMEKYTYRRTQQSGAYMYIVEVPLKEIREVTSTYTVSNPGDVKNTTHPDAVPPVDAGKVQSTTPKTSVLKSLVNKASEGLGALSNYLGGG